MPVSDFVKGLRAKVGNELLHFPAVGVVAFDATGRVLLVRAAEDGKWTIPGGMVEPGELPAEAAIRETKEETGLDVELIRILGVFGGPLFRIEYPNGDRVSFVSTTFEGKVIGGNITPDGSETVEARYFSKEDLSSVELKPYIEETLRVAFQREPDSYYALLSKDQAE